MKRALIILSFIVFSIAGAGAERYNFSAVCESGQTLYYIITSSVEPYTVKVTYPQYYNYGMYLGNVTYYHNHTTPGGDLTIPDTVTNGGVKYAVKSIDDCAFYGCGFLTTITIPNSVTSIGIGAFTYCTGLTTITIPDSVTTISVETFLNCDGLTEVIIPNSVTNIDENAFKNCPNLQYNKYDNALYLGNNGNPYLWLIKAKSTDITSCEISDNCEHIYHYAFQNCQKITTITIPESVKDFGIYAFSGCSGLESVTIPNTITSIADDMFNNCSNLDFTITNYITSIGDEAFCGCSKITYVNIPNSVTNIGSRAFNDCANLKSVTIPKSVVYIGENAFVSNDISIYCEASNSNGWYYRCDSYNGKIYDWHNQMGTVIWDIKATIADDFIFYVTDTIKRQCGVCKYIGNDTDVVIPSTFSFDSVEYSVTDIGESAFYRCSSLASISIPNGVTTIGYQAFENCRGLTSINLPDSLTKINNYAFCDCIGLTSINFPDSLKTIGWYAFAGCSGITSVIIPDKVTWIGKYAFDNCSGLAEVTIPKTVIEIQGHAFTNESTTFYCEPLSISAKWKRCDNWNNCEYWNNEVGTVYWGVSFVEDGIAYRKISDSVVSVRKCLSNDSFITVPQTVSHKGVEYKIESIDEEAFSDCSHIKFVLIKNHIVEIGSTAFNNSKIIFYCEANDKPTNWDDGWNGEVGTVYWGVKIVDGYISHVTNASSHQAEILKYIGADSVLSIPASVTFGSTVHTVTTICESVFKGFINLKSVTIPNTIVSIGDDAFNGCNRLPQIIIPNTVTTMGQGAFGGCSSLSIYCAATSKPTQWSADWNPDNRPVVWGVKAEGDFIYLITNAARREVSIIKYTGNGSNVVIPSKPTINGLQCNITGIGDYAFAECGNLEQITIPNSVQIIGNYAFAGCAELSQIIIGSGITSIGESAFSGCGAVSYIKIGNATPPTISESTFEDIDKWITVDVPCTNIDAYMNSNYWSDFVNYYEPPVYDITVNVENSKCGTAFVTRYPTCDNNQAVFNVTSNTGFAFDHWNDGNTDNPRTVAVTKDTSFTAFYSAAKINVSITTANATQGSVTDLSGIHYYSDEITISATANYGYHFTGWSDNVTTNPRTITLIKDTTIQAQFAINQYEISVNCNETERGTVSGGGSFNYLIDNTILATANYGYEFVHWSDNNTDNPRTIHLTCDTAFTAVFAPKVYELQVTSANEDLGNVAGSNSFEYKTVATISATAIAAHHHFVQWNDGNRQNPRQVTVERDTLFVATFGIDTFRVAAASGSAAMGAVSGAGLYSYGSAAKVEAKPAAHHHFVQWKNGAVQTTQEFVVEHDTAFEAVFAIDRHTVALAASDSLCGAVSGAGSYDYGASVQLQATPAANCYFTGWSDGVTANPRTLTVEGDTNIVAEFEPLPQFSIKVEAAQAERGAVSGAGEYVQGSQVTLSATAAEHYVFSQWSDGRTDNPRTVRVIADATYTAVFEPMEYYVKLAQNNANMGMVSGDGVYSYGTVVSCLATPYPNYHFVQWSNGERANPYEFVVSEDVPLLTAYFAEGAVTGIEDDAAVAPVIYAVGKTIIVENATNEILVYDAMGKLLCRDVACRVRTEITVNGTGVYIVKTGNAVMRVVVE